MLRPAIWWQCRDYPVAAQVAWVMVPVSASLGCGTYRMESADEFGAMPRKPPLSARLFATKLNQARLQSISLQERPKPILDVRQSVDSG